MFKRYHELIFKIVRHLQEFAGRVWYPQLIGFLAFLDSFILIIPTDGVLISSCMLRSKKWISFAFHVTLGSTLGAILLYWIIRVYGEPLVYYFYPAFDQASWWQGTVDFFTVYGLFFVFFIGATPLAQQPVIILSGLTHLPLNKLAFVFFAGRIIKYFIMAYVGSKAPHYVGKLWGLQGELKEVGVELKEVEKHD